ncbi:MAG: pentapeptide repeat-containing protein [Acidobacteriota bacterium]
MQRSMWRSTQIIVMSGVLAVSGVFMGQAQASDPEHVARLTSTRSCANCDLSNEDLSGWVLEKADLSGANLSTAKLYKATLVMADLTGANLTETDLTGANLSGARGAVLSGAKTDAKTICPDGAAGPCK